MYLISEPRLTRSKWKLYISEEEWTSVQIVNNKYHNSLKGHMQLLSEKISKTNPHCVLKFVHNRVKKTNSRKRFAPFFTGKAECKFEGCTKYDITIKRVPIPSRRIKVRIKVKGNINHKHGEHRRHVTGKDRIHMAAKTKEQGPSNPFYNNLSKASEESIRSGNMNGIPSKSALRQMLHEILNAELLDRDVFREIDIVGDVISDFIPGGYIRYYGKNE